MNQVAMCIKGLYLTLNHGSRRSQCDVFLALSLLTRLMDDSYMAGLWAFSQLLSPGPTSGLSLGPASWPEVTAVGQAFPSLLCPSNMAWGSSFFLYCSLLHDELLTAPTRPSLYQPTAPSLALAPGVPFLNNLLDGFHSQGMFVCFRHNRMITSLDILPTPMSAAGPLDPLVSSSY